ncbi:hypothetical protein JWH11_02135 [Xanthomonas melonis]|uniref:Uncharacterized protein n=1 Tax=Xanthomonas melonis TaxID=56456 RepID=A0ABS8NQL6_9XANT|nr:hypothetical protein [Xanthomonas melonis]MCD0256995.1 hypothetical protein [Xanthomonas melonis]MCD0265257.1 hypothetical protein [Xanthomonas melonis]
MKAKEIGVFKRYLAFFALVISSLPGIASAVTIRAGDAPYNQVAPAQGITVLDDSILRVAAMYGLWGMYRTVNGITKLPRGSTFDVIYSDGSSEKATVACVGGTVCVIPVPGTQKRDDGTLISNGGGGGGAVVMVVAAVAVLVGGAVL